MNISHTCCVSLVGFDWGPNPSLGCMNVGLNIHQMLSQNFMLSCQPRIKAETGPVKAKEAQPWVEPQSLVYLFCISRIIQAALQSCLRAMLCWGLGWGHFRSISCLLYYCLQVPPLPFNPQWTTSSAVCSLRVSLELLTCILWGSPQGRFDAWFIIHVLIIESFRHLPGGGCCSTLPSTHN